MEPSPGSAVPPVIAARAVPHPSAAQTAPAAAARSPQARRRAANQRLGLVLAIIAALMLAGTFVIAVGLRFALNFGFGS
jgi:predicted lipid-binding transport protein (Tim44 family)